MKNALTVARIRSFGVRKQPFQIADGRGLTLEVRPSGRKVWLARYSLHGRRAKLKLGLWPQLSISDARKRHSALLMGISDGVSPSEQLRREKHTQERGMTVEEFGARYLREHVARVRKKPDEIERYLRREVYPTIGKKPLAAIEKQELREIVAAKLVDGKPQAALAIRNILKRLLDYAIECEITEKPVDVMIPKAKFIAPVSSRSRALNESELRAFLCGLDKAPIGQDYKDALLLILFNLVRKSELRLAEWKEFDLDAGVWVIPPEHSKTDAELLIGLSRQALAILRRRRECRPDAAVVFPMRGSSLTPMAASTLNRALRRIPLKIKHFTVHDLRRSAATNLAEKEFNSDWIEKALNHKLKGVRGVYNRAEYAAQRKEMLQAWADRLDEIKLARS